MLNHTQKDRETIRTSCPSNDGGKKMHNIYNLSDIFWLNNSFCHIVFQVMLFPLIIKCMINFIKEDRRVFMVVNISITFLSDWWENRPCGIDKV